MFGDDLGGMGRDGANKVVGIVPVSRSPDAWSESDSIIRFSKTCSRYEF